MQPNLTVFTAVDGTLLDANTNDAGNARATIATLHELGITIVPVSPMTLEELAPIATGLGIHEPMIIEAGTAIARPRREGWDVEACGVSSETLLDVVRDVEDRTGANLFVDCAEDVPRTPFTIESGDLASICGAAADVGFAVRRGRRYFHLCRECDEGEAFARLRDELRCDVAIAVGSTVEDAEFLSRADIAIVIPGPNGQPDAELLAKVPHARVAPAPAPYGWTIAVEEAVAQRTSPLRGMARSA